MFTICYIDPGTGSMLISSIIAGLSVLFFALKDSLPKVSYETLLHSTYLIMLIPLLSRIILLKSQGCLTQLL